MDASNSKPLPENCQPASISASTRDPDESIVSNSASA